MEIERKYFVESFIDLDEAEMFLESKVALVRSEGYTLSEASLVWVNKKWRVGILGDKTQGDLFEGVIN